MDYLSAIILAAGEGKRLKATINRNKVAYNIGSKPIIAHTLEHLHQAGITSIIAVVGFASESVKTALGDQVTYVDQTKRLGTGHAVRLGLQKVPRDSQTVLTMYGDDSAFYPPSLFRSLVKSHLQSRAVVSVVTLKVENPFGLGRIVRSELGDVVSIIEEKNAEAAVKSLKEINTGLFCFNTQYLKKTISRIKKNPVTGEYYLTDIVALTVKAGLKVNALFWPDSSVWHGVNTLSEWRTAEREAIRTLQNHPRL